MKSAIILCFANALATDVTLQCDTVNDACVENPNSEANVWPGCGAHGSVACPAAAENCLEPSELCHGAGGVRMFLQGDTASTGAYILPESSVLEHEIECGATVSMHELPTLSNCATWYEYRDPIAATQIRDITTEEDYLDDPRGVDPKLDDLRCVGASFGTIYNNESFTFDCTAQNPCPVAIRSYGGDDRSNEPFSTIGCGACIRFLNLDVETDPPAWLSTYGRVVTYTDIGLIDDNEDLVGHYPPRDVVFIREGIRSTNGGGAGDHAFQDAPGFHVMAYLSNDCEEDVITVGCSTDFETDSSLTFTPCTDSNVSTDATCTSEDPCPISVLDASVWCGTEYTHAVGDGSNVHYTVTHHHSSDSSIWVPEIYVQSDGWNAAGQVADCDKSVLEQNFDTEVYFFKYVESEITELTSTTTTPTEEGEEGSSGAGALTLAAAALVAVLLI